MSSRPEITATMWDCGGVLLTNGWDHHARRQVVEHFGMNFEEFEQRHTEPNDEWERGKITLHEYLARTVFYVPRAFCESDFFSQMREVSRVLYAEMIQFLRTMRAEARPQTGIYLLSNESRELMEYRIPQFGLRGLFDAYLVSAYIGLRKPERAFFQCALDITQREPGECLFIDDREENVAAAAAAGMNVIRMESPRQAIAALKEYGLAAA